MRSLITLVRILFLFLLVAAFLPAEAQKRKKKSKKKESRKKKKKDRKKKKKGRKDKGEEAALSREEKKQWKKKLKQLSPAKYKNLMTEYYGLEDHVSQLEQEVASCQKTASSKDKKLKKYGEKLKEASEIVSSVKKKEKGQTAAPPPQPKERPDESGVLFRVQIGAYKNMDLTQYSGQENFGVDKAGDVNKYMVGAFRDYREADSFKKYLRQMGVKDAWVVAYRDGARVDVNEVIQGK